MTAASNTASDPEATMAHYDLTMPVTEEQVRQLRIGDTVTLQKTLFGIRDASYIALFDKGRSTRFDLNGHAVIHTAPNVRKVPVSEEFPAGYQPVCIGTTTSSRMERDRKSTRLNSSHVKISY